MLYYDVSVAYFFVNIVIAVIVVVRSRQNVLSQFYAFCVACLLVMGVSAHALNKGTFPEVAGILWHLLVFVFAVFPFFFLHFMLVFVRRYEILKSKTVLLTNYFAALFSYVLVLLKYIPAPFSVESGLTTIAYTYYITWMSIMFAIGVALLYSLIGGFSERGVRANLLFGAFAVLMLLLPTPFTLSLFNAISNDSATLYFFSSTGALAVVVYIVFRHRITQNTPYQAMKSALAAMNDILMKTDEDFRVEMVQGGVLPLLGYHEKELLGGSLFDLIDERERLMKYRISVFQEKRHESFFDTAVHCKSGDTLPMEFSFTPVFANEEITGFVGVGRNIKERRRAEKALQESEARYRSLFENNPMPMWVLQTDSLSFMVVNEAAVRHYGYTAEKFLQLTLRDLLSPEDTLRYDELIMRGTEAEHIDGSWAHRKENGDIIDVEVASHALNFGGRPGRLVLVNDVTEQRKLSDQLRQAQKLENLGKLAGGIAHDFNNILAIIMANSSILERLVPFPEKFTHSVATINRAVERAAGMVRQLLTFARKTDALFGPVNVKKSVEEIITMLESTFPKTVTFTTSFDPELPDIFADANQMHQALMNLCVNARDAMADTADLESAEGVLGITVRNVLGTKVRGKLPDAQAEKYVAIEVSDTGSGMDEVTKKNIFEPFFTTKSPGKGTGLGLAVVYGVVKSHRGFIEVESERGKGTTFRLYFPVPDRQAMASQGVRAVAGESGGGSETILFVEDEEMLLDSFKTFLEERGYRVLTAKDGEEAVQVYEQYQDEIAIVVSDIGLPKLGGWEAFQRMKQINPAVKVILGSGLVDPNFKSRMLRAGAKDFISKPYVPDEVLRRIRSAIAA